MYISSLSALQTFANFVDPDEMTSYDELSSGSTLFAILFCQIGSKTDLSTRIYPGFANSVDPDQLVSDEANWSGSALFAIKYANL